VRVLIDTGALQALSRVGDQHHREAIRLASRHVGAGGRFVGTTLILSELYSHLLYLRGAEQARAALSRLLNDPIHEWFTVSTELVREALDGWLGRFADQNFSLVDAVSFEVMRQEALSHAFAFDHRFETAGYVLLR
jgi:uncharacterized protein